MSGADTLKTDDPPTATAADEQSVETQPADRATAEAASVGPDQRTSRDEPPGDDTPVVHVVGMWRRLLAGFVDLVVLFPVLAAGTWLVGRVVGISLGTTGGLGTTDLGLGTLLELLLEGGAGVYSVVALVAALSMLYAFVFVATTGRTPGLKLLRGRVINVYGERPEWWRAFLRCWAFVIGVLLLGLGLVWIGFDRHKRGLHDWLAGTYVIRQRA